MTDMKNIVDLFQIIMLECVDEGGEDEDAHGKEEGEHAKLFVAVPHWKLKISLRKGEKETLSNLETWLTDF